MTSNLQPNDNFVTIPSLLFVNYQSLNYKLFYLDLDLMKLIKLFYPFLIIKQILRNLQLDLNQQIERKLMVFELLNLYNILLDQKLAK
jgi:hypothetical protein